MHPLRLLVLSSTPVVTSGLPALLADHEWITIDVSPAHSGPDDGLRPDVVLFDALRPARLDVATLWRWVEREVPVVVLVRELVTSVAVLEQHPHVRAVMLDSTTDELGTVLLAARNGLPKEPQPPAHPVTPAEGTTTAPATAPGAGLTVREVQILSMIAAGCSNAEIADRLYLSPNTVKTYIRHAYRRLGVDRRSQAIVWCIQNGLLDADQPLLSPSVNGVPTRG